MMVKALKTVKLDDGNYFIDLRLGQFRRVDTLEAIDFDSRKGIGLCRSFGIFQCPRCGQYDKFIGCDGESKLCPECEKLLWRGDYQ